MLKNRRFLTAATCLLCLGLAVSACGRRGSLEKPRPAAAIEVMPHLAAAQLA
ncbi:LPS translocon maturation chaperone LptM [Pannonibacter phragmitetus]|uniref:LPS translocon maturation chaperone LptM n=1 Tax=Pannonibacter phragmitetus TaxID=121719 RepID=UPI003D2F07B5